MAMKPPTVEGQEEMFPAPKPKKSKKPKDWTEPRPPKVHKDRAPVKERAGTKIDHSRSELVTGTAQQGTRIHGTMDFANAVFQCGGELSNFVFWREKLVSIALDAWEKIEHVALYIEVVDHDRNECWRVSIEDARRYGHSYEAGIGPRWGVPLEHWTIYDKDWRSRRP